MKPLVINENKARELYKTASPEFKQTLEDTFGKEFFSTKVTDRVKTYEDACAELGEQPIDEEKLKQIGLTDDEINYRKLKTVTKALNEGWIPDWTDSDQQKWQPYFRLSSSAFAFDAATYYFSYTGAGSGSRLCFKNERLAEYAGRQFVDIWNDLLLK